MAMFTATILTKVISYVREIYVVSFMSPVCEFLETAMTMSLPLPYCMRSLYSLWKHHLLGKHYFPGMGIPIINLRKLSDCFRLIMGIPIPVRWCLYSEWRPTCVLLFYHVETRPDAILHNSIPATQNSRVFFTYFCQVMAHYETVTVSNLVAHEWAVHSLI